MATMPAYRILPRSFYERRTLTVAPDLLGKILVREHPQYGRMAARIVETEAYLGFSDKASHARFGRTKANEVEFGPAGYAYVFTVFGMYHDLDIVTEKVGVPTAVLIRAAEPLEGIDDMKKLRGKVKRAKDLTNGPGKLCKALDIGMELNGCDMCVKGPLYLEDAPPVPNIVQCKRLGVAYAGEDQDRPWRFYIKGNPYVSKRAPGDRG